MRNTRMTPLGINTFAVRVDSYNDGEMSGVFCVPGSIIPVEFSSLTGLIMMIEDFLDTEQETVTSLERPRTTAIDPNIEIEVLFRQNHSWQGCVRWVGGAKEATFRSVLELIIIMETVFGD